jgi:hypothetical protein
MSRRAKEMVSIEVYWVLKDDHIHGWFLKEHPEAFWFIVKGRTIHQVTPPEADTKASRFYGVMIFTPIASGNNYPIAPYVSELNCETDSVGMEEAFAPDVETVGKWAFKRFREGDRCGNYNVYSYVYRDNYGGKDSETEYTLVGLLDMDNLPSALMETTSQDS